MKIVYKKSILDKILEATIEAKKERKQIDYIELTREEEKELERTVDAYDAMREHLKEYPDFTVWGVKIKVEGDDD